MSDNRLLRIKNMKGKLCFFVLKSAIQRGPRANLAWLRYVLVFAFESGQTANLERVGSILLFANQSGPRAILERLGCVLLFANQGGPRANLKRLGCVRMFATKSRPKGNIYVGVFFFGELAETFYKWKPYWDQITFYALSWKRSKQNIFTRRQRKVLHHHIA